MARVYMRKGRWAFDVRIAGKRYRKVVGTSRDETERALRRFMEEQAGRHVIPTTTAPTAGDLIDSYTRYVETHLRPASAVAARTARRPLQRLLGRIQADRVGVRNVEQYRETRLAEGVSRASVNREVGYLRAAFRRAADAGELEKLPPRSAFKRLKMVKRRPSTFEPEEVGQLMKAVEWRLRPAIALAYYCGLRLNEVRTLTWSDVDEARGLVLVREKPNVFVPKDHEERAL
ncbi:MAG: tyrosine-type recombinase/integrase, partial [Myxococcota bacterium]